MLDSNKTFGKKTIAESHPHQFGIKVGYELCINDIFDHFGAPASGIGYPIGIFWRPPHKKTSKYVINNLHIEIGLCFLRKELTKTYYRRIEAFPKGTIVDRLDNTCPSTQCNIDSFMLPLTVKYYPGTSQRWFSINMGFFITCLVHASKTKERALYLRDASGYELLKDNFPIFCIIQDEAPALTAERKAFKAEWDKHNHKKHTIPLKKVSDNLLGVGWEFSLEYETPSGLMFIIPHVRLMTHPGHWNTLVGLGYNIGRLLGSARGLAQ
ncbi:MAG: hypothetical protein K2X94_02190 [Amoebophilaceae bacterium]|nr:hypothetical protein [Amoebophilaceae bacterium]